MYRKWYWYGISDSAYILYMHPFSLKLTVCSECCKCFKAWWVWRGLVWYKGKLGPYQPHDIIPSARNCIMHEARMHYLLCYDFSLLYGSRTAKIIVHWCATPMLLPAILYTFITWHKERLESLKICPCYNKCTSCTLNYSVWAEECIHLWRLSAINFQYYLQLTDAS